VPSGPAGFAAQTETLHRDGWSARLRGCPLYVASKLGETPGCWGRDSGRLQGCAPPKAGIKRRESTRWIPASRARSEQPDRVAVLVDVDLERGRRPAEAGHRLHV